MSEPSEPEIDQADEAFLSMVEHGLNPQRWQINALRRFFPRPPESAPLYLNDGERSQ